MRCALVLFTATALIPPASVLHAQDSIAVQQLLRHALPVHLENGTLSGAGAAALAAELDSSQFFLIGESHGFAEVPALTAALFDIARPKGYRHLAIEVGPFSASHVQSLAAAPLRDSAFARFHAQFPFTLSFYMWRDEQAMAQHVVSSLSPGRDLLWGLDQEVMFAPAFLLRDVADSASEATRRAADSVARRAGELHKEMLRTRNPMAVYMMAASDSEIEAVRTRLANGKRTFPSAIFDEMIESRHIYKAFFGGAGWESNSRRAALMKRHFRAYYDRATAAGERQPKVMFKFGANHMMKGREITNTYDLGSLANEIAVSNGSKAFNLLVVIAKGTQNAWLPFAGAEADKSRPFTPAQDRTGELQALGVAALLGAAPDTAAWTLLDTRRLRPELSARRLGTVSTELERLVWAYDAVLVIPTGHAATLASDR